MIEKELVKPDYLFEVSWEVCNKVGGIYTVISTKALTLYNQLGDNYILIGPDVWKETRENPEFTEDRFLFRSWREDAEKMGLRFKIGRWKVAGNPVVILVDFTPYFALKDKIFAEFWEKYHLDSLSGHWDYVEPMMFGYAAAKVIESFYDYNISARDKVIAQFHEWMTGSGILYIKDRVPQVGTVFTTHATALARSIAGNGLPLYKNIEKYVPETLSKEFGIVAKQSLERLSAKHADCFTTVSEITAKECKYFLKKEIDIVTPNGFEDSFVPNAELFEPKRSEARKKIVDVAEALLNEKIPEDAMLVGHSGRYEFKNKGIDVFIKALGVLNKDPNLKKTILAVIMIPGNQAGPRRDVFERIGKPDFNQPHSNDFLTHYLHDADFDPVLNCLHENGIDNSSESKVKAVFIPSYLNGYDGIFNMGYYELLIGFDVTVCPSYYEPWGYTPMESLAFRIPTITTSLAGFGVWVNSTFGKLDDGVAVIERDDDNDSYVVERIAESLLICSKRNPEEKAKARKKAYDISRAALWPNFIKYYQQAYSFTLAKAYARKELFRNKQVIEHIPVPREAVLIKPTWRDMVVKSEFPEGLSALTKLSKNLWWSWTPEAIDLFASIDQELWEKSLKNPIVLFEMLSYDQLLDLEKDSEFTSRLDAVYKKFTEYMDQASSKLKDQIAYFSMEFGLHDSVKIFSGGLGILAGDYLKQSSDSNINMVGVGLLYRHGYFKQNLAINGDQIEVLVPQRFEHLPLQPVLNSSGENDEENWLKVKIAFPGRTLYAKVWQIDVGRIPLYLLDTDIEDNTDADKSITYQLYGGDWENRLKQELLLGVGGIRLLDALNLSPALFHCNEGHAAFIGMERLRKLVQDEMFNFNEATEIVRASTLFTTHTPVPAGHDAFSEDMLRTYTAHYAERLHISWDTYMNLGRYFEDDPNEKFSMSVLASKLSQEINGVSRIHGRVTREMFNGMWPGFFPEEMDNIGYVTNGVHYPTWVSPQWRQLYEEAFGEGFMEDQSNKDYWRKIFHVSDQKIWKMRQEHRKELIDFIKARAMDSLAKRLESPKNIIAILDSLDENALTFGFARRFATYKRAHLLFSNLEKLSKIVNDPQKPVQFIFAGKAHPHDKAGQDLIKYIIEVSRMKEFVGKIIFLENYDMELAKKLVQGVDIWLNTPTRPLEASGTSGQKAVMNGVVNFSVLDGWWAEGYIEKAGWALKEEATFESTELQDQLDAETIYDIIEEEIVPIFYKRDKQDVPSKWVSYVKNTIAEIAPLFTTKRMIDEYNDTYYKRMILRSKLIKQNDYELAKSLSAWKKKVMRSWNSIEVVSTDIPDSSKKPFKMGGKFVAEITLDLNELSPYDIGVEIVFGRKETDIVKNITQKYKMTMVRQENKVVTYRTEIFITRSGVFEFAFRIFPKHELLPNPLDFNLVKWI